MRVGGIIRALEGLGLPACPGHPLFSAMLLPLQELRTWEEELTRAALQQKTQEELLRRREQELAEREIDILERELNIIIHQLCQEKPRVKKRKGKFRKSRLKLKDGNRISLPSGQWPGTCWGVGAGGLGEPGTGLGGRTCWVSGRSRFQVGRSVQEQDWPAAKLPPCRGGFECD